MAMESQQQMGQSGHMKFDSNIRCACANELVQLFKRWPKVNNAVDRWEEWQAMYAEILGRVKLYLYIHTHEI